ncbi:AMP deaminase [Zalerion maritima]|uniref:AMP deaminase n=1 Tax=Zalerion maritima TaxID=339359 RepID=A0AAD5WTY8_9PEZI|nr:AMP deaminase [Zalerion maritima]
MSTIAAGGDSGHSTPPNQQDTTIANASDDEYDGPPTAGEEETDSGEDGQAGWHQAAHPPSHALRDNVSHKQDDESTEGMLPRDIPKHTPYYDPVAERQMSQTDAKLFYQRSQSHVFSSTPGMSPHTSPTIGASLGVGAGPGTGSGLVLTSSSSSSHLPPPMSPSLYHLHYQHGESQAGKPGVAGMSPTSVPSGGAGNIKTTYGPADVPPFTPSIQANPIPADTDGHVAQEFSSICQNIQKIINLRRKYIALSSQGADDNPRDWPGWKIYPPPPDPAWRPDQDPGTNSKDVNSLSNSMSNSMVLSSGGPSHTDSDSLDHGGIDTASFTRRPTKKRKPGHDIGEDFDMDDVHIPGPDGKEFQLDDNGVYQVYESAEARHQNKPIVSVPTIKEFYVDLDDISAIASDGPSKSFAFRRLQYLESRFSLYAIQSGYQEIADSKRVPHRDFYNVRKVDTHVHHSACMNQKHLLRFIKSKLKKYPHEKVLFRDGKLLSLTEVFESIKLTAYDLSIDTLDMHAHTDSFHRFDKFNLKYNPIGESRLRTIFLKTDNDVQGRYLAEITKEVIADLESSKYQMVEWRVSIYGKSLGEWDNLAAWVVDNKLFSHNVRWLVQIPRLYDVYKASKLMETYEQIVKNIFQPLFEVTQSPQRHPKLHVFLQRVIGFDSVDDESKIERRLFKKFPVPKEWESKQNPPYSYWIYYMFANMASLNAWRKQRCMNTLVMRPHCGEAGDSDHLASAALCCHSISHGLLLRKVPLLQYVFYLEHIGIAMSPLSNNALFLAYERNPFNQYFKRGLNVSLSTDDPLQFAFTKEPLIEEYAVAAQIYKLNPVDMCELAKNSVKQSGFERAVKQQWLGDKFELPGRVGNEMVRTNVPDIREDFRYNLRMEEWEMLDKYISVARIQRQQAESRLATIAATGAGSPPSDAPSRAATVREGGNIAPQDLVAVQQATLQGVVDDKLRGRVAGNKGLGKFPAESVLDSLMASSPQPLGPPSKDFQWSASAVARDSPPHMSQYEPRIFPGLVSRRPRGDSLRKTSLHESDTVNDR